MRSNKLIINDYLHGLPKITLAATDEDIYTYNIWHLNTTAYDRYIRINIFSPMISKDSMISLEC